MARFRKKILLLLAGGTWLLDKNQRLLSIQEASDIPAWLNSLPELSIMADLEPVFISSEEDVLNAVIWEKMAKIILAKQAEVDGFIIVSRNEQLTYTASALTFLLANFAKNIILTSSYLSGLEWQQDKEYLVKIKNKYSGLGLKANLINAIQALDYKLPQPAIMFGTRLLAAVRANFEPNSDLNLFSSLDNNYWGRVDFGVNVKTNLPSYKINLPNYNKLQAEILILNNVSGLPWLFSKAEVKRYKAIIIKGETGSILEPDKLKQIKDWARPIVLYNFTDYHPQANVFFINNCTWSTALIKTMWLAANVKSNLEFGKLLNKNLIGEYLLY